MRLSGVGGSVRGFSSGEALLIGGRVYFGGLNSGETVFTEDTSVLFKETRIVRMWDAANHTLIYLAISRKLIEGAPMNSISTVPVMPWGGK